MIETTIQLAKIDLNTLTLYVFCPNCDGTTKHIFAGDVGKFEVYTCEDCGQNVEYAVR